MREMRLQVDVDPSKCGAVEGAISFETGLSRSQAADPTLYAYEHHGDEFSVIDPGALSCFYEDLVLGRSMPSRFVTRSIGGVDTIFAITLFMHRDLVPLPTIPGVVASVDLIHRRGIAGMAHIDESLAVFLFGLASMFPPGSSKKEEAAALKKAAEVVERFLSSGELPYQNPFPQALVKDVGSDGFVRGELARGSLLLSWAWLFRQGYLRGFVVGPEKGGLRSVVATRKSLFVPFNLPKAASLLNEVETQLGGSEKWSADEIWLHSPSHGTVIGVDALTEVFLRV